MFRRTANLLASLLLVATLLWGGCVACPQFFQVPIAKSCCDPAGHCKNTGKRSSHQKSCQFQQVEVQKKLQPLTSLDVGMYPGVRLVTDLVQLPNAAVAVAPWLNSFPESPHHKQALLSAFLI
jgi:hypothetical protein